MKKNYEYFLVVAEELNITKASTRLFISQQGLSNHIKRLENTYGVKLFNRKPYLSLTESGRILELALKRIKVIEKNLESELGNVEESTKGQLQIGIHSSRSAFIGMVVIPEFWKKYPQVEIKIIEGVTRSFEKNLLDGEIDFFIGVNPRSNPAFKTLDLMQERIFLIITDNLLKKHFPHKYPNCKKAFENGIDFKDFKDIPFFIHNDGTSTTKIIKKYLSEKNLDFKPILQTNSNDLSMQLAFQDFGACCIPGMHLLMLSKLIKYPHLNRISSSFNVFPFKDLNCYNEISLVTHKDFYYTKYQYYFQNIIQQELKYSKELLPGNWTRV